MKLTADEVSFEWSHHRISSTDSEVRITLNSVSITNPGSKGVNTKKIQIISSTMALQLHMPTMHFVQLSLNFLFSSMTVASCLVDACVIFVFNSSISG